MLSREEDTADNNVPEGTSIQQDVTALANMPFDNDALDVDNDEGMNILADLDAIIAEKEAAQQTLLEATARAQETAATDPMDSESAAQSRLDSVGFWSAAEPSQPLEERHDPETDTKMVSQPLELSLVLTHDTDAT